MIPAGWSVVQQGVLTIRLLCLAIPVAIALGFSRRTRPWALAGILLGLSAAAMVGTLAGIGRYLGSSLPNRELEARAEWLWDHRLAVVPIALSLTWALAWAFAFELPAKLSGLGAQSLRATRRAAVAWTGLALTVVAAREVAARLALGHRIAVEFQRASMTPDSDSDRGRASFATMTTFPWESVAILCPGRPLPEHPELPTDLAFNESALAFISNGDPVQTTTVHRDELDLCLGTGQSRFITRERAVFRPYVHEYRGEQVLVAEPEGMETVSW